MFDHYEWFKKEVYRLTQIDLNYYKEKQMRRRIDTLAKKNGADSYETYIDMILQIRLSLNSLSILSLSMYLSSTGILISGVFWTERSFLRY